MRNYPLISKSLCIYSYIYNAFYLRKGRKHMVKMKTISRGTKQPLCELWIVNACFVASSTLVYEYFRVGIQQFRSQEMNVARMSHFETDLPWASEQRFSEQLCVWVAAPQVCGAPGGFDGHLIRWRRIHVPVRRPTPSGRAEACWFHGGIVQIFTVYTSPLHSPSKKSHNIIINKFKLLYIYHMSND